MGADSLNKIMQNRSAIRRIMSLDSNGSMDTMIENAVSNGSLTYSDEGAEYKRTGKMLTEDDGRVIVNDDIMSKSKMPKKILESFQQNPGMSTKMPVSVLDELGVDTLEKIRKENVSKAAPMNEQSSNTPVIDYSLLRTIINEAVQENVKKYMSALSKKLMLESTAKKNDDSIVEAVKLGDKFSFITTNGDVYEATLKYKTNLKESKNKKNDKNK